MKILLALDPFGHSHKALDEALRLTKLQSAELLIMAVAETFHDKEHSYVGVPGGPEALVPLVQQKMAEAESLALKDGVKPKIIIEKGEGPVPGIMTRAREEKVDLIIVGHRERHGLDLFILGSVATKVVNNAHCSVLVVR
jgi:nucleotide-binding universal stress UspA family protein